MKKILILEDEIAIWMLYERKLKYWWFEVKHAVDPDEMFEILKKFKPDIFLLDHWISGHNKTGTECIPDIRKTFPNATIYALSNYHESDLRSKFPWEEFRADKHLVKLNYSPNKLLEFLEK